MISASTLSTLSTLSPMSRNDIKNNILSILGDNWEYHWDSDYLPYQCMNQDDCTNIVFTKKKNRSTVTKLNRVELVEKVNKLNYGDVRCFTVQGCGLYFRVDLYSSYKRINNIYSAYETYKVNNKTKIDSVRKVVDNNVPMEFIEHYCYLNSNTN